MKTKLLSAPRSTNAQVGDYQLPLLTLRRPTAANLWKYARMRLTYLKTQRSVLYSPDASERFALAAFAGSPESRLRAGRTHDCGLGRQVFPAPDKERSQLLWAAHMNTLKAQAEEVVVREIVYQ